MRRLTKTIFAAIGFWFLALILIFVFPHLFPVISGFALIASLPIAAILLILTLIALIKERNLWPVAGAALILAIVFIALPRVMHWGARVHLCLYKQTYENTAQRMLAARTPAEQQSICGEQCWVWSSERSLVAFHYVHGFLNWHDIIYDPNGKVVALESWDERKRFDTYFISAEHLTGDWYVGHFGD